MGRTCWLFLFILFSCQETEQKSITYRGEIMGTTYSVVVPETGLENLGDSIQQFLELLNNQVSTYVGDSEISQLNRSDSCQEFDKNVSRYFLDVFKASKIIYDRTQGYFDPTIGPLVDYWGFGVQKRKIEEIDKKLVEEKKALVNFSDIDIFDLETTKICKKLGQQLNFNAIAKGYAVDKLVEYLIAQNLAYALVEIGGETRAYDLKSNGEPWTIGINRPEPGASVRDVIEYLSLTDVSIATSGDYRIFYESDGRKFVHIINPFTGYPEESPLVSVTVIHKECMIADGYATGLMVAGLEEGMRIANSVKDIEAYFIYFGNDGNYHFESTDGFRKYIKS